MSEFFHKSCYTARSTGYKYRTLSTNTGTRRSRDVAENNILELKFRELRKAIISRIDEEMFEEKRARESIQNNFDKVNEKINTIIILQSTVSNLRKDLENASAAITDMNSRVDKINAIFSAYETELNSPVHSLRRSSVSEAPIIEEKEEHTVIVTQD